MSNDVIISTIHSYSSCSKLEIPKKNYLEPTKYKNIRLGTYIEKHLFRNISCSKRKQFITKKQAKSKARKTYTVNSKLDFCNNALEYITSNNMTRASKKVIESILDFVIENNPN